MAFPLAAIASVAGQGAGMAANPMGLIQDAAGKLTGAFTAITGSINAIAGPITQFVQAINPAIVAEFHRAMRDLNATIGIALMPIMESLTGVVREIIGSMMPIVTQLQPIIAMLAQSIASVLVPWMQMWGQVIIGLMPVFEFFAEIVKGVAGLMADYYRAILPVISVLFELGKQLVAFVANLLGVEGTAADFFENLRSSFQLLIKNVILAAATFLKMIGATDTLGALIKGLKPPEQGPKRGIATLENAKFSDFASIAKSFQLSAFQASAFGGKGGPKKTDDFLAELLTQVQDIKDGKGSPLNEKAQQILDVMNEVWRAGTAAVEGLKAIWEKLPKAPTAAGAEKWTERNLGWLGLTPAEEAQRKALTDQSKAITGGGQGTNNVAGPGAGGRRGGG